MWSHIIIILSRGVPIKCGLILLSFSMPYQSSLLALRMILTFYNETYFSLNHIRSIFSHHLNILHNIYISCFQTMFVQGVECYEGSRSSDTSTIYVSNTVKFVMSNDCFLKGIQKTDVCVMKILHCHQL
jgi:hypothetical protein